MKECARLFLLCLWLTGCYSTRSVYDERTTDQNGVETYRNPRYETSTNWFGWTLILGATAGGAYAGYKSGIELEWETGHQKEEKPIANAAIGGLTAGLTSLLINGMVKPSTPAESSIEGAEWVKNMDEHLIYIGRGNSGTPSFKAIQDTADRSFVPYSVPDLELFLHIFPESPERNRVALESGRHLDRPYLPTVIKLLPETDGATIAKERLIDEASDVSQIVKTVEDYPELRERGAARGATLTATRADAEQYNRAFPGSPHFTNVLRNVLPKANRNEIGQMLNSFKGDSARTILAAAYLERSTSMGEIIDAVEKVPELRKECERKAAQAAATTTDYRRYLSAFPEGESAQRIREELHQKLKQPENLGTKINSEAAEYSPVISPDGTTLYFVRRYTYDNVGAYEDEDIWYSSIGPSGDWSEAINLGALNNDNSNAVVSVTPDGNTLLLHGEYGYSPFLWTSVTSMTHRIAEGWSDPESLEIEGYENRSNYSQRFLTNDGKAILLAIETKNSYGEHDLYVSFLQRDGSWSKPKNLGKTINTTGADDTPFLASDGRTLYFSSDGHGGHGGKDLFTSRRLDDSWTKWSAPMNLGDPINTEEDDDFFFLPASGDIAYYSSSKSGYGYSDLFRVALPEEVQPLPVVLIAGRVLESETGTPLEARVVYEDLTTGKEIGVARTDPATGTYKIALPPGAVYGFRAEAPGYVAVNDNLDLSELKAYQEQSRNLSLVPIQVGQMVRVNNLFFDLGKSTLRPESYPELNRLTAMLKEHSTMAIEIQGHTDSIGTEEDNLQLSQARAGAVAAYLTGKGISGTRLGVRGFGETRSIAPNDTDEGRRLNRRVEFLIRQE